MRATKAYKQNSKSSFDVNNNEALINKRHQFKYPKTVSLTDDISTAGRTESFDKRSEPSVGRNHLSEDSRLSKTTFNEVQLKPIKRLNHSLKDANLENNTKTPIILKNSKMDGLTSFNQFSANEHFSKSTKNNPGIAMVKSNESRNHSIFSASEDKAAADKQSEVLTDKLIRKSNDFVSRKQADEHSKSVSTNKSNKTDFATLSFNSRKRQKDKDLKESVSMFRVMVIDERVFEYY
jgi:hypothetical protein